VIPANWSRKEWKRLKAYIKLLRDELGLSEWALVLEYKTTGDDGDYEAWATIHPREAKREAEMHVAYDFREQTPEKQRYCLTHELLHLYHRDSVEVMRLTLPKLLGEVGFTAVWEPYRQLTELMVDNMARMLAPRMPLPDIVRKKKSSS
jgi:hypothetical protein